MLIIKIILTIPLIPLLCGAIYFSYKRIKEAIKGEWDESCGFKNPKLTMGERLGFYSLGVLFFIGTFIITSFYVNYFLLENS
jgi:hypothetical protein